MTTKFDGSLPSKRTVWKDIVRLAIVGLFFGFAALILNNSYIKQQLFDIDAVRSSLSGSVWNGAAVFTGVASLLNAIGVPKLWICVAAGTLFGAMAGIPIGYTASLIGSASNFFMGRYLLRGPVNRHMPRRLRHWYNAFNNNGFRTILYLRLFPFTNATLTNIVGGASQISFRDYISATAIGFLPFVITFSILGSSAAKQNGWQLFIGLALFAVVVGGQWGWSRLRKRRRNNFAVKGIKPD